MKKKYAGMLIILLIISAGVVSGQEREILRKALASLPNIDGQSFFIAMFNYPEIRNNRHRWVTWRSRGLAARLYRTWITEMGLPDPGFREVIVQETVSGESLYLCRSKASMEELKKMLREKGSREKLEDGVSMWRLKNVEVALVPGWIIIQPGLGKGEGILLDRMLKVFRGEYPPVRVQKIFDEVLLETPDTLPVEIDLNADTITRLTPVAILKKGTPGTYREDEIFFMRSGFAVKNFLPRVKKRFSSSGGTLVDTRKNRIQIHRPARPDTELLEKAISSDLRELDKLLEKYREGHKEFPTVKIIWDELASVAGYREIFDEETPPLDPWNNAYSYTRTEEGYRLWTIGIDQKPGTRDDIQSRRSVKR